MNVCLRCGWREVFPPDDECTICHEAEVWGAKERPFSASGLLQEGLEGIQAAQTTRKRPQTLLRARRLRGPGLRSAGGRQRKLNLRGEEVLEVAVVE